MDECILFRLKKPLSGRKLRKRKDIIQNKQVKIIIWAYT